MSISVIIPTLNAEKYLPGQLSMLQAQKRRADEIIVIDSESTDSTTDIACEYGCSIYSVPRREFNHGGTRNIAAGYANGKYLVFLTQDALPVDTNLLQNLAKPLEKDRNAAMGYGRQIAYGHARSIEKFVREFNYPPESYSKQKADIDRLGVKTFFCSNACAIYNKQIFTGLGGFREDTIMNEDMEFVFRAVMSDYKACYAADAAVWHSHDYTLFEQFKRYVDIGVFFANNPVLKSYAKNESEGIRYISQAARYLTENGEYASLIHLFLDSLARFVGYRVGYRFRKIPVSLLVRISMNRNYWRNRSR